MIEADVLVVGCGPAGLTAANALSRCGVRVYAVTKHAQLAPTPRAHVTNQRSFEILRDFGLEEEALAHATPYEQIPNEVFLRSLRGPEYGRIRGLYPMSQGDREASPCPLADLPQNLLEPILFQSALTQGVDVRFSTELLSFEQDADAVTSHLADHVTGEAVNVRSKFMIGADGGRSLVAANLGLPFEGAGKLGGALNILFDCDLSAYVLDRPGPLFTILRTVNDAGGAGLGILRSIKRWSKWLMIQGYAPGVETPHLTRESAVGVIRDYLGVSDLEVNVSEIDSWDLNSLYATTYQHGRVFCMGDAVHRHPPSNGLGSNTAIQDAYNLAWKLALVIQQKAGASLLDSYSLERVPVGRGVVERTTNSMGSYDPILKAVGALDPALPNAGSPAENERTANTAAGLEQRKAIEAGIRAKVYEFQTRGLELNQRYVSSAVDPDGEQPPTSDLDPDLHYIATTYPGARLPHAWVQRDGKPLSTLDLVGKSRFTLLTGIGGEPWRTAAEAAASALGIDLDVLQIGPGCEVEDLYFDWSRLRETGENGCILVRPDAHIAWRSKGLPPGDLPAMLTAKLRQLLSL